MLLSGPLLRLAFVFSLNSLISSGFPLTSFHLTEASLSAFLWFYTLVCAVVQRSKCLLSIFIHIFSTHFAINLFYMLDVKKLWKNNCTCIWTNKIKTKTKPSHAMFKLTRVILFDLAQKQCNAANPISVRLNSKR